MPTPPSSETPSTPSSPDAGARRRRALALAVVLDVVAVVGAIVLTVATGQPIFLAFGLILAVAPWAAVIDDAERRR
jgi:hypothetical protein